jgi:hypothetical protein
MSQTDDTTPAREPEPYEYFSAAWTKGRLQETDCWCYAAAEQTIQAAFGGGELTQAEIAHRALMSRGEIDDSVSAHRYYSFVKGLVDAGTIADTSWATVEPQLDEAMVGLHRGLYGDLNLVGRDVQFSASPPAEILLDTLIRNGLVAYGDEAHWRLIYGYSVADVNDLSQGVWFRVFDPEDGNDDWVLYDDTLTSQMNDTRLVRG